MSPDGTQSGFPNGTQGGTQRSTQNGTQGGAAPDPVNDLLGAVLAGERTSFALVHRPESAAGPDAVEVLAGPVGTPEELADLPLEPDPAAGMDPAAGAGGPARDRNGRLEQHEQPDQQGQLGQHGQPDQQERHELLALVPYRQIRERGFDCADDGAPLVALRVREQLRVPLAEVLGRVPDTGITLSDGGFDVDDDAYAATARRIIDGEIGSGEGANFVLRRSFTATVEGFSAASALTLFRRLLRQESGAYWTFVVHTPHGTFVGASPERHVSLHGGTAVMNPISGTYRYPASGPALEGVKAFLADRKEADELYMVVDEELKMMARICDSVPRVVGPRLKEMARLAHTEYHIEGASSRDPREILRETMFAPTVTGSPLESACRVVARHEPEGRGHYSGAVALIGRDAAGGRTLDSAILIRTAEISPAGALRLGVGATVVRHSDPASEVHETRAKASGMLAALESDRTRGLGENSEVRSALARRNEQVSGFWLGRSGRSAAPELADLDVLVVDAEDTFTAMLAHQLRALGPRVEVRRYDEPFRLDGRGLVVMGPGPGDPRDTAHPKIGAVRGAVRELLRSGAPFLAVCLSHQALSLELGLEVARRDTPNQGAQHTVDLFGRPERVGFYNTFAARCDAPVFVPDRPGAGPVEVARDAATGEVHALRGPGFASLQFHPESLLTQDGVGILSRILAGVVQRDAVPA